ncbi:MAG: hypothetical protein IJ641_00380 [Lachnospiraceae bacterium]|nr:hypothetical protein [Lachnospiraceae bacterium]
MSENNDININGKLSDDALDDVNGGTAMLNNTLYNKSEGVGLHTAIKDDTMDGKIRLLNDSTKSVATGDIGQKTVGGSDVLFGQQIQNL